MRLGSLARRHSSGGRRGAPSLPCVVSGCAGRDIAPRCPLPNPNRNLNKVSCAGRLGSLARPRVPAGKVHHQGTRAQSGITTIPSLVSLCLGGYYSSGNRENSLFIEDFSNSSRSGTVIISSWRNTSSAGMNRASCAAKPISLANHNCSVVTLPASAAMWRGSV